MSGGWIDEAARALKTPLHHHARGQAAGPCPVCGGTDRLCVWQKGNFWCRRCGHAGRWSRNGHRQPPPPPRQLAGGPSWLDFHLNPRAAEAWAARGLTGEHVERWGLGLDDGALTWPVFAGQVLLAVRRRNPDGAAGPRYAFSPGDPMWPWLAPDAPETAELALVVEGDIKAMSLHAAVEDMGWLAVSLPSARPGRRAVRALASIVARARDVVVVPDPDVGTGWDALAASLGASVLDLPAKPDDWLAVVGVERLVVAVEAFTRPPAHRTGGQ